jgi:hypothetical protein
LIVVRLVAFVAFVVDCCSFFVVDCCSLLLCAVDCCGDGIDSDHEKSSRKNSSNDPVDNKVTSAAIASTTKTTTTIKFSLTTDDSVDDQTTPIKSKESVPGGRIPALSNSIFRQYHSKEDNTRVVRNGLLRKRQAVTAATA